MEAMQTQTANPPSFESVWATLDRIALRQEETDRIVKETSLQMQETREQMRESALQADKRIQETEKQLGKLGFRMGEIVEHMVAPNLREKFWEMGLNFNIATTNSRFYNDKHEVLFEVDVFLQNGDKALLVEVKTKLTTEDVKDHIERLEKMRTYADLHGDKRTFLGAVAGVVMESSVKKYALGQGLYVIEPSGETFNVTPPNGLPKEW